MRPSTRYLWIAALFLTAATVGSGADIRIELIQGKRPIQESVSFTIEVSHEVAARLLPCPAGRLFP